MGWWQDYFLASSVHEALDLLATFRGEARVIAGGTDLIPQIKRGEIKAKFLVDISRLDELNLVRADNRSLVVGAAVRHSVLASSELVVRHSRLLAEAARSVGSPQIRNQGTVGGNVINAQPAADTAVALMALDAEAEIVDTHGARWLPLSSLYAGVGKSAVDPSREIVTRFRFRLLGERESSTFMRLAKRRALALPMINVGVALRADSRGRIEDARIAIGPVGPVPFRAKEAERSLRGQTPYPEVVKEVAQVAAREAQPRDSILRGSALYRKNLVALLVERAIKEAQRRLDI